MRPSPDAGSGSAAPDGRARRVGTAAAVAAAGLVMVVLAASLGESRIATAFAPGWWPGAVGVAVVALGAGLLVRPEPADDPAAPGGLRRLAAVVAVTVLGVLLWPVVGFVPAAAPATAALLAVLGERRPAVLVLLPLALVGGLYALFALLLRVPL